MSNLITIDDLFEHYREIPIVDVRSPAEFAKGHISGAINIPLFDNNERSIVGTLYKKSGQKEAILTGLEFAGKKMRLLAENGLKAARNNEITVYCWRGGMRSAAVAWLFETCGINCYILKKGYKSYRNYIHGYFSIPFKLVVLGGLTGSGKSGILDELGTELFQVLKLETIAHHKGSAFGSLGEKPQNTNEQFENELFTALSCLDIKKPIFVEDESRNIGRNIIPDNFFERMTVCPLIVAEMDKELRITRLVEDYGKFTNRELQDCVLKISKRIGIHNTQLAISALNENKPEIAAEISLFYYDKTYNFGLSRKKNTELIRIKFESTDAKINTKKIIDVMKEKNII